MKRIILKTLLPRLLFTLLLLSLAAFPALASEDSTSEPGTQSKASSLLPSVGKATLPDAVDDATIENPSTPLPNPGNFFGEGSCSMADYAYEEGTYDVWVYPQDANWGKNVNSWIAACEAAKIPWDISTIDGNTAYLATSGELTAILIPDYNEVVMLMLPTGMEMEGFEKPDIGPIQKGEIRVDVNGTPYTFTGIRTSSFLKGNWSASDYNTSILLAIPTVVSTGDTFTYQRKGLEDIDAFSMTLLMINDVPYLWTEANPSDPLRSNYKSRFTGDADSVVLKITYAANDYVRGTLEGVFDDGKTKISLEFYLPTY